MMITSNRSACRRRPCLVLFLHLLLLAAAAVAQAQAQAPPPPPPPPPSPPPPPGPPIYHVYWDIRSQTFDDLRNMLIPLLLAFANTAPYLVPSVSQIRVLGPRRLNHYDAPPAWIYIHVKVGEAKEERVTLAMAIDDLYILGFCNGNGDWYKFSGGKNTFQGLPGARVLPIEENYRDVVQGGRQALDQVPLGKQSATDATKLLATYDPTTTTKEQLQDGLSRFVAMLGEGMRLRQIRETFSGSNWEKVTFMTSDHAKSVVDWGSSSRLLIRWFLTGRWGEGPRYKKLAEKVMKYSKIDGPNEALNNRFDFLLRPLEPVAELTS